MTILLTLIIKMVQLIFTRRNVCKIKHCSLRISTVCSRSYEIINKGGTLKLLVKIQCLKHQLLFYLNTIFTHRYLWLLGTTSLWLLSYPRTMAGKVEFKKQFVCFNYNHACACVHTNLYTHMSCAYLWPSNSPVNVY